MKDHNAQYALRIGLVALIGIVVACAVISGYSRTSGASALDGFTLEQNYPNPFSASTEIQYTIPSAGHVLLRVFNTLGQEVARPLDEDKPPGKSSVRFDGASLPSGQYNYSLQFTSTEDHASSKLTRKMYLLR